MGIACALMTIHFIAPATAAPLTLTPPAQSASKALAQSAPAAKAAVAKVTRKHRAPNRMPTWNTYTMGNADLAFLSAGQYLELSSTEEIIPVVSADELSPLDLTAGSVRFVSPDEVNELDLAHEPALVLAQQTANHEASAAQRQEVSATPAASEKDEEDDGVLNRILMTFAGALAMAGAMRMFMA
jgi:hypothetical protein